jgi:drug/metabolite transporter (DMT)-like permease
VQDNVRDSVRDSANGGTPSGGKPAPDWLIGVGCGVAAAVFWAMGFVAAKHGVSIGFTPADLAFHRFFWSGLFLMPAVWRAGFADLGGVGWGRGLLICLLSGPTQALLAYSGFILVPLGHGTTIQPACAALFGLLLAVAFLHERLTTRRLVGAAAIVAGLFIFGAEALETIGTHGVGGDLLFVTAGVLWAIFGTLLRHWRMPGTRAVTAVAALSVLLFAPLYLLLFGTGNFAAHGWFENLLQIVVQGVLSGVLPIYLFARAVTSLGAGRAAMFPALVPVFSLIIGFIALGIVPTWPQLAGLAVVVIGFRLAIR